MQTGIALMDFFVIRIGANTCQPNASSVIRCNIIIKNFPSKWQFMPSLAGVLPIRADIFWRIFSSPEIIIFFVIAGG
jgi:hypothetical protein